ncbi:MAG: hypothetical protein M0Z87_02250 [Actinomycetota bacterium]|nr:hypothetical protein [Actinomycetota bacterium]
MTTTALTALFAFVGFVIAIGIPIVALASQKWAYEADQRRRQVAKLVRADRRQSPTVSV